MYGSVPATFIRSETWAVSSSGMEATISASPKSITLM